MASKKAAEKKRIEEENKIIEQACIEFIKSLKEADQMGRYTSDEKTGEHVYLTYEVDDEVRERAIEAVNEYLESIKTGTRPLYPYADFGDSYYFVRYDKEFSDIILVKTILSLMTFHYYYTSAERFLYGISEIVYRNRPRDDEHPVRIRKK